MLTIFCLIAMVSLRQLAAGTSVDQGLCQRFHLGALSTVQPTRRVYDCFQMNSELEMMEIRLNTLYQVVDYFVVIESKLSYRNTSKPLFFRQHEQRFQAFVDKIIYIALDSLQGSTNWEREWFQRQSLVKGLQVPGKHIETGDIIMLSDLDEIPRPEVVRALKVCDSVPDKMALEATLAIYSFSLQQQGAPWARIKATVYNGAMPDLQELRMAEGHDAPSGNQGKV
ncbi:hypothetical protein WJX72_005596 [[Myrmecia] bisecta]|uniref:Glycosyltransferase family 17 n=1 Tax=[Myrmecia] bisecta TaxID=41462 RepID=A0AAW1PST8_9CHLO